MNDEIRFKAIINGIDKNLIINFGVLKGFQEFYELQNKLKGSGGIIPQMTLPEETMSELKITVDQLKNYLGVGLDMKILDYKSDYVNRQFDEMIGLHQWDKSGELWNVLTLGGSKPAPDRVKPICYRLSDLDKFIPELGFVPLKKIRIYGNNNKGKYYLTEQVLYSLVEKIVWDMLIDWHFWLFGDDYFEEGLVIDKLNYESK